MKYLMPALFSFTLIAILCLIIILFNHLLSPVSGNYSVKHPDYKDNNTIFIVKKGSTLKGIAASLESKGIIRSKEAFILLAIIKGYDKAIKAGAYLISPSMSSYEILHKFASGDEIRFIITVAEGKNSYDIGRLFEDASIFKMSDFIKAARDKELLEELKVPFESAEGLLFPDTYYVPMTITPEDAIRMFVRRFWDVWEENGLGEMARRRGMSLEDVVILASIVEKEALLSEERPLIASVFLNRLKRNMRLQADPTVRYGLLIDFNIYPKRLRTRHLRHKSPYNTYLFKGLPKGPICNPGLESIKAVLNPAKTDYLYFVSMNNGAHKFSRTLKEHNRAVYRFQIKKIRGKRQKVKRESEIGKTLEKGD